MTAPAKPATPISVRDAALNVAETLPQAFSALAVLAIRLGSLAFRMALRRRLLVAVIVMLVLKVIASDEGNTGDEASSAPTPAAEDTGDTGSENPELIMTSLTKPPEHQVRAL